MSNFQIDGKSDINKDSDDDSSDENVVVTNLVSVEGAHGNHVEHQVEDHEVFGSVS